ncbi:MAG: hypothetical protein GY756_20870 [bacterium]|nr:hypothetical protein [bacterium]
MKQKVSDASRITVELIKRIPLEFLNSDKQAILEYFDISEEKVNRVLSGINKKNIMDLLSRGDFVLTEEGLKCIEFNISGNLGGYQISLWENMYTDNPIIKNFIKKNNITIKNKNFLIELFDLLIIRTYENFCLPGINITIVQSDSINDQNREEQQFIKNLFLQILKSKNLSGELLFCGFEDLSITGDRIMYNNIPIPTLLEMCFGEIPDRILDLYNNNKILIFNGPNRITTIK